jgi:nucleotide-binding universal stress UspA family protein
MFADSSIKPRKMLLFDEKAEEGILRLIEESGFDLVVLGSRGLDATKRKAMGSTSMRVLEQSSCPALIIH